MSKSTDGFVKVVSKAKKSKSLDAKPKVEYTKCKPQHECEVRSFRKGKYLNFQFLFNKVWWAIPEIWTEEKFKALNAQPFKKERLNDCWGSYKASPFKVLKSEASMPGTIITASPKEHEVPLLSMDEGCTDYVHCTFIKPQQFVTVQHFMARPALCYYFHYRGQVTRVLRTEMEVHVHSDNENDLALVTLSKPIPKIAPKVLKLHEDDSTFDKKTQVSVSHFKKDKFVFSATTYTRNTETDELNYKCDTQPGTCGAPVRDSQGHVMGIHKGTTGHMNHASIITNIDIVYYTDDIPMEVF